MCDLSLLKENEISKKIPLHELDAGKIITENKTLSSLLREAKEFYNDTQYSKINEFDKIPSITVDCILQKANTKNRNGRIYPKIILERQAQAYQTVLTNRNSFSETDHPDSPSVSLKRDNLSHIITKTWWDGDVLYGTIELITSPAYHKYGSFHCVGDFVANLLDKKMKLGISSRGLGSVKKMSNSLYVQPDFELICFDIVSSPSTSDAYLSTKLESETINESIILNNNDFFRKKLENFLKI